MKHMIVAGALLLALPGVAANAQSVAVDVQTLVSAVAPAADGLAVELTFLNVATGFVAPPRIAATIATAGQSVPATLVRSEATPRGPTAGFVQVGYTPALPADASPGTAATLSLGGGSGPAYAFSPPAETRLAAAAPAGTLVPVPEVTARAAPAPVSAKPDAGNAYLANLSSYQPIYAVYGPGTNSDARIQVSFKYQLFGTPGAVGPGQPWENGIHFAFTQRMFWNLGAESSPFRSVDFMPEVFYLLPATRIGDALAIGAQAGFQHQSNGRDGLASRSLNTVYVQPVVTTTIAGLTATIGPRLWLYAGSLEDNPDIKRYRGNTGLFAEIGRPDSWRLTTNSRLNPASGKGAIDAELSYPLDRIVDTALNVYVFGQAFAGYGENLFDYNKRVSRVRIGVGFVR